MSLLPITFDFPHTAQPANGWPDVTNKTQNICTVMPHDEPEDMIETKQLIERLEGIERNLKSSADERAERHKLNNVIHGALGTLAKQTMEIGSKTDGQDTVLQQIKEAVARIEGCLLGDPQYQRAGLIADVVAVKAEQKLMAARLSSVEEQVRSRTRAALVAFSVLGVAGGVITWIKSTGFFKLFTQ